MVQPKLEEQIEQAAETPSEVPEEQEQDIDKLRSVLDRQIAGERRRADDAETEVTRLQQLATEAEQQLEILRTASNVSEDVEEQAKAVAQERTKVNEERAQMQRSARAQQIETYNLLYGVPKELLEKETDPKSVENVALRWAIEHRQTEEPEKKAPESPSARMQMATVAHAAGSESEQALVNRLGRGEPMTTEEMVAAGVAMGKGLLPKVEE